MTRRWKNMNQTVKQLRNNYALLLVIKTRIHAYRHEAYKTHHKSIISANQQMANCLRVNKYMFATICTAMHICSKI